MIETDAVSTGAAVALHYVLDTEADPPAAGGPLPPLWHWLAFLPRVPQSELGTDGHPRTGSLYDPGELSRRMFAGGRLWFPGRAVVGEELVRRSEVVSVTPKDGRSGPLLFVTIEHRVECGGALVVREEQDIVYRPPPGEASAGSGAAAAGSGAAAAGDSAAAAPLGSEWIWEWDLPTDPTLLFRFSALTYNAHRIHYDRRYACDVEGYPGLVVHGPLQAIALAELCRRHHPERPLASFTFRALHPAFEGSVVRLRGRSEGDDVMLAAFDHAGRTTMEASATLGP